MSVDFDELALVDLSRHFGRRKVLTHVSFTCRAGEIVGLLGPNGAGKSTLLSIVSTLVSPSAGEVRYGGRTASTIGSGLRARLGLLSHDLHLYPELTARENLTFFGELYALNDVPSRVDRAVALAGLTDRADDYVSAFSRGMRQRLALARAFIHGPKILLLDEPFTSLDDRAIAMLSELLVDARARGVTIVLSTHQLREALAIASHVALVENGRLRYTGERTQDMLDDPGLLYRLHTELGAA